MGKRRILAGFLLLLATATPVRAQEEVRQEYVRVTFYTLHGYMADSNPVYKGAAACSHWIPFGTQLMFNDGYIVTCEDRGHGDYYWPAWVDVWAPSYRWGMDEIEAAYGTYTWVSVIRWGWNG